MMQPSNLGRKLPNGSFVTSNRKKDRHFIDRILVWPSEEKGDALSEAYRDFSALQARDVPPDPQPSARAARRRKGPKQLSFPTKLYDLLKTAHEKGLDHIVCWQEHGRSFTVVDPHEFAHRIMPSFFNQSKFHSFQRQLNLYGFKRQTTGPGKNGYYHELFLRERRYLAQKMKRIKEKGSNSGRQGGGFLGGEPDLFSLPFLPEFGGGAPRTMSRSSNEVAVVSSSSSSNGSQSITSASNADETNDEDDLDDGDSRTRNDIKERINLARSLVGRHKNNTRSISVSANTRVMVGLAAQSPIQFSSTAATPDGKKTGMGFDEMARMAQRCFEEVKGQSGDEASASARIQEFSNQSQNGGSDVQGIGMTIPANACPPSEAAEGETAMILHALSAVAPYYSFPSRRDVSNSFR